MQGVREGLKEEGSVTERVCDPVGGLLAQTTGNARPCPSTCIVDVGTNTLAHGARWFLSGGVSANEAEWERGR